MLRLIQALRRWMRGRARRLDIEILWPMILRMSSSLDEARTVFMLHCMIDPAWTTDFTEDEVADQVAAL